jgi:small subunit ribosomal protein S1
LPRFYFTFIINHNLKIGVFERMDRNNAQLGQGGQPEEKKTQNKNAENYNNMETLLEREGVAIDFPKYGEIRQGVIASIGQGQILVSVGAKSEGIISGREYDVIPSDELAELEVGQEIPVFVVNPEDQDGNLVLSYVRARDEAAWQDAEKLQENKESFKSKIVGYNKGGLLVPLGKLRGFVPASQVSLSRRTGLTGSTPEERWGEMVGEEIEVCVIEVDRNRRRLILSERAASSETRESIKEKVLDELNEGDIRTGRVTSLADFGAFVNISGADGLVHLSEISWDRIKHPNEVLKVGEEVKVKVISIDREKKRIGLSIRQLQEDPLAQMFEKYQKGQLVEGTITRLTKFGAFARLEEDIEGLIHISEISEKRIEHPKEILHEGDVVTLRVIKVDPERHRIGLSIRRVDSMAYADMDWQTLLDEEILEYNEEEEEVYTEESEGTEAEVEAEAEAQVADAAPEEDQAVDQSEEPEPVDETAPDQADEELVAEEETQEAETQVAEAASEEDQTVDQSEEAEPVDETAPNQADEEPAAEEETQEAETEESTESTTE